MDSAAKIAIDKTPGTSPWDWKTFPNTGGCAWCYDREDGHGHEYVALRETKTLAYKLVLGVHCHPFAIAPEKLGLWFPEAESVRIVCFEIGKLPDLPRPARFTRLGIRFHAGIDPLASLLLPQNLPGGIHKLSIPRCLDAVSELLMVAPYGTNETTTILSLKGSVGELSIYPQLWFDEMFKGGWESIERVTRHPVRRSIIGSGSRIRPFELTDDARCLANWL